MTCRAEQVTFYPREVGAPGLDRAVGVASAEGRYEGAMAGAAVLPALPRIVAALKVVPHVPIRRLGQAHEQLAVACREKAPVQGEVPDLEVLERLGRLISGQAPMLNQSDFGNQSGSQGCRGIGHAALNPAGKGRKRGAAHEPRRHDNYLTIIARRGRSAT